MSRMASSNGAGLRSMVCSDAGGAVHRSTASETPKPTGTSSATPATAATALVRRRRRVPRKDGIGAGCSVLGMGDSPVGVRVRDVREALVTAVSQCATRRVEGEFLATLPGSPPTLGRVALRVVLLALLLTAGCGSPPTGPALPGATEVAGSWT